MLSVESAVKDVLRGKSSNDASSSNLSFLRIIATTPSLQEYARNVTLRQLRKANLEVSDPAGALKLVHALMEIFPGDSELADAKFLLQKNVPQSVPQSVPSNSSVMSRLTRDFSPKKAYPRRAYLDRPRTTTSQVDISSVSSIGQPESKFMSRFVGNLKWSPVSSESPKRPPKKSIYSAYVLSPRRILASSSDDEEDKYVESKKSTATQNFLNTTTISYKDQRMQNRSANLSVEREVEIGLEFRRRKWFRVWKKNVQKKNYFLRAINDVEAFVMKKYAQHVVDSFRIANACVRLMEWANARKKYSVFHKWRRGFLENINSRKQQIKGVNLFASILGFACDRIKGVCVRSLRDIVGARLRMETAVKFAQKNLVKILRHRVLAPFLSGIACMRAETRIKSIAIGVQGVDLFRRRLLMGAMDRLKRAGSGKFRKPVLSLLVNTVQRKCGLRECLHGWRTGTRKINCFRAMICMLEGKMTRGTLTQWKGNTVGSKRAEKMHAIYQLVSVLAKQGNNNKLFSLYAILRHSTASCSKVLRASLEKELAWTFEQMKRKTEAEESKSFLREWFFRWKRKVLQKKKVIKLAHLLSRKLNRGLVDRLSGNVVRGSHREVRRRAAMRIMTLLVNRRMAQIFCFFKNLNCRQTLSARLETTVLAGVGRTWDLSLICKVWSGWKRSMKQGKIGRPFTKLVQHKMFECMYELKCFLWKSQIISAFKHCDAMREYVVAGPNVVKAMVAREEKEIGVRCLREWLGVVRDKNFALAKLMHACSGRAKKSETIRILSENRVALVHGQLRVQSIKLGLVKIGKLVDAKISLYAFLCMHNWYRGRLHDGIYFAQTEQARVTRDLADAAMELEKEFSSVKTHNEVLQKQLVAAESKIMQEMKNYESVLIQLRESDSIHNHHQQAIRALTEENRALRDQIQDSEEYRRVAASQGAEIDSLNTRLAEYSKLHNSYSFYKNKCILQNEQINSLQGKLRESQSLPTTPLTQSRQGGTRSPILRDRVATSTNVLYSSPIMQSRVIPSTSSNGAPRPTGFYRQELDPRDERNRRLY